MKHIKTQAEFDALVASTPTNEKVLIHPKEDGTSYTLANPWNVPSNAFIEGITAPVIEYIGDITTNTNNDGLLNMIGSSGSELTNITIRNLVLKGNTSKLHGISCSYVGKAPTPASNTAYDSTVKGNTIVNLKGFTIEDCIITGFNRGIYLNSSSNSTINGTTSQNNTSYGIHLGNSNNNTITSNTTQNNFYGFYSTSSSNNTITGNTIQNNAGNGFYLATSCNNSTIVGNTLRNNRSNGFYIASSSNNTITGNTIQNNGNISIYLQSSSYNAITGNNAHNNNGSGIYLNSSSNYNTITSNIVQSNSNTGIHLTTSNNTVTSNTVQNNSSTGIFLTASSTKNMVYSNVVVAPVDVATHSIDSTSTGNLLETTYNKLITLTE